MNTICISLGGSIISRRNGVNVSYVRKLSRLLKKHSKNKFIITVGGGYANSLYIKSARQVIRNELVLDEIGIAITRINALIVKDLLSDMDVYPNIVTGLDELRQAAVSSSIVVMGGLLPGVTTDSVSILACEVVGSKELINVSKESWIYDRPPDQPGAKRLAVIDHNRMIQIASERDTRQARSNFVFDLMASKLARRGGITVKFVNDDIDELALAISGRKHNGSIVR